MPAQAGPLGAALHHCADGRAEAGTPIPNSALLSPARARCTVQDTRSIGMSGQGSNVPIGRSRPEPQAFGGRRRTTGDDARMARALTEHAPRLRGSPCSPLHLLGIITGHWQTSLVRGVTHTSAAVLQLPAHLINVPQQHSRHRVQVKLLVLSGQSIRSAHLPPTSFRRRATSRSLQRRQEFGTFRLDVRLATAPGGPLLPRTGVWRPVCGRGWRAGHPG